jgi:hypothetical protein
VSFVTAQQQPKPGAEIVVRIVESLVWTVGGDDQAPAGSSLEL